MSKRIKDKNIISDATNQELIATSSGDILKSPNLIPGDNSIDISELHKILTENNFNAAELRKSAWKRKSK